MIILCLKYQTSLFFSIKHNTSKLRLRRTELSHKLRFNQISQLRFQYSRRIIHLVIANPNIRNILLEQRLLARRQINLIDFSIQMIQESISFRLILAYSFHFRFDTRQQIDSIINVLLPIEMLIQSINVLRSFVGRTFITQASRIRDSLDGRKECSTYGTFAHIILSHDYSQAIQGNICFLDFIDILYM